MHFPKMTNSRSIPWKKGFFRIWVRQYSDTESKKFYFQPLENYTVYELLKKLPNYESTFFNPAKYGLDLDATWTGFKPSVQEYRSVFQNKPAKVADDDDDDSPTSPIFTPSIVEPIIQDRSTLTDVELWSVLYLTNLLQKDYRMDTDKNSFIKLWNELDAECVQRYKFWDKNTTFQVADLWYHLQLARVSNFHWLFIKKLFRKCDKLTKEEYVRFMFCLNLLRKLIDAIGTYELEHNLNQHVESLCSPELGTVAMAFFKTECPILDNNLLEKFIDRAISCSSDSPPVILAAISKLVRLSSRPRNSMLTYKFQDGVQNELDRLNITGAVHVAIVGTRNNVKHSNVVEKVATRIENNLQDTRLKEIERILLAVTMFSMDFDPFIQKVIQELENPNESRAKEIKLYGKVLTAILFYSSIRGIYSYKLANIVFDPEFLRKYYGINLKRYQRELYCLDHAMEIECPDYTGHKLSPKVKQGIAKYNMLWLKPETVKVTRYEASLRGVNNTLAELFGGKQFVYSCNILPQYHTAETVFCLDDQNNPVEIPSSFRQIPEHEIKNIIDPKQNHNYHVVFLGNYASTINNQPKNLVGHIKLQIRLLEKMGYKVHVIYPNEWEAIQENSVGRMEFIKNLLFNFNENGANVAYGSGN